MSWLSQAQNLPLGRTSRCDCPQCGEGTNTNAAIINHTTRGYSLFCHACGYNPFQDKGIQTLEELKRLKELNEQAERYTDKNVRVPSDITEDIPLAGRLWLYNAGISPTIWKEYNVGYSESLQRVILPVYGSDGELIWYQGRAVHEGQRPKYLNPTVPKDGRMFVSCNRTPISGTTTVIVCEDILSAIRVGKATSCLSSDGNKYIGVSLLGTKLTTESINTLSNAKRIISWFDADAAGSKARSELYKAVGIFTTVNSIRSERDPKRYSDQDIRRYIEGALNGGSI